MVYLLGVGACVSFYFMYRNKKKISFELLKYYTYLDEFFTKFRQSEETSFLYPTNDSLVESSHLKPTLINLKDYGFPYIITRDFIVKEEEGSNNRKSKEFYQIYQISQTEIDTNEETDNVIQLVNPFQLGIKSIEYENNFIERCFKNHLNLFETLDWQPPIIAASLSIIDKNKVYTFREFDISHFLNSLLREGKILNLDNESESKILWIHLFNYIFKDKNILIPADKDSLDNYTISWTIVFDNCDVKEGTNIELNFTK